MRQDAGKFRSNRQLAEAVEQLAALCSAARLCLASQSSFSAYIKACIALAWQMPVATGDLCCSPAAVTAILNEPGLVGPFLKSVLVWVQDGVIENNAASILN